MWENEPSLENSIVSKVELEVLGTSIGGRIGGSFCHSIPCKCNLGKIVLKLILYINILH